MSASLASRIQATRRVLLSAAAAAIRPRPKLLTSDWADDHRQLTSAETSAPGKWKTSRVPYIKAIMDDLSPHSRTQRVVFMKPTQVAGTETIINWAGATIDVNPGPMLIVQPTIDMGELFSKQRLENLIANCPALRKKIPIGRSRDGSNTTLLKKYPGGLLRVAGANSASSLRMMPARDIALDECDAYPDDLDGEGSPIKLAEERANNFPRRKIYLCSTPTVEGASTIKKEFEASDQRYYHVPCPHCLHKQRLVWDNLQWNEELTKAWYVCAECGVCIEEKHKTWMLENGEWIARFPGREAHGYHLNSLYSPIGLGRTWLERAKQFLQAKDDPTLLKTFINTCLAETWRDASAEVKPETLSARAEDRPLRVVPPGCLVLTLGVDVQNDRLECQLVGWGRNSTAWVLDYVVLPGDTSDLQAENSPWKMLDVLRDTALRNSYGRDLRILMTAIDSGGHRTHEVYNYVRMRRRVIAIKGASTPGKPVLGRASKVDVNTKGGTLKEGADLWLVGSDTAKHWIYGHLLKDAERSLLDQRVRFSVGLTDEYYRQLTAEVFDPTRNKWVKLKGRRNEALDTFAYAFAAACHPTLRINVMREADWEKLALVYEPVTSDLFAQTAPPPSTPVDAPPPPARKRGVVSKGVSV